MANKADNRKDKPDESKSLGVLYTGYLDKKNPVYGSYKKRFVVLTQSSIHWFKREEGCDLFGEERGQISLVNILATRILDEDSTMFEIQTTDNKKKFFQGATNTVTEEWVSAIRSASKALSKRPNMQRRATVNGSRTNLTNLDNDDDTQTNNEIVTVSFVSLSSAKEGTEVVITRNPEWDRIITLPIVKKGDQIIMSTSNGGSVNLSYEMILSKAEDGLEFDVAVQNVPLASSLKISLLVVGSDQNDYVDSRRFSKKVSAKDRFSELTTIILTNRNCAICTVLSMMVIMAGISSLDAFGINALLFVLLSTSLSAYNLFQVYETAKEDLNTLSKGITLRLIIHGHAFTSPDVPITESDNDIPQRFIDGCDGDLKEARRRWDITRHWRESEGVNNILDEPQPYFNLIKAMYPHYQCGRGKSGNLVYYERPGEFQGTQLAARGVTTDDLVRHWIFNSEYQWQVLCNNDETAKSVAVLDLAGIKLSDLAGDNLNFVKRTVAIANQHYPERSQVIFVINAPYFFSMAWKLIKNLVHENTQKKIRILSTKETLQGLQECIDFDQIPVFYGGGCDFGGIDSCRFMSAESVQVSEYVKKLNEKHTVQSKVPFSNSQDDINFTPAGQTGAPPVPPAAASPNAASSTNNSSLTSNSAVSSGNPSSPLPPGNPGDTATLAYSNPSDSAQVDDGGNNNGVANETGENVKPELAKSNTTKRGSFFRGYSTKKGKKDEGQQLAMSGDDFSVSTFATEKTERSKA